MPPNQQQVNIKKVVHVKHKRSIIEFFLATVTVLSIILVVGAFFAFSAWMYTYSALTEEKVVAELYVSKKIIKDGVPTFKVRYVPISGDPVMFFWGEGNSNNDEIKVEMYGDQFFVDASFIRWQNWMTLLGFDPVYKVYRVKSDYRNLEERNKYRTTAFDINGGPDKVVEDFAENEKFLGFIIQSGFISSAGQNVGNEDQVYNVVVTKDAIVLEKK